MEFPETLEKHLRQVAKHVIEKTTTELQELFRHHWKTIRGNSFWDFQTGNDLWQSCHTQLKSTSKSRVIYGNIDKWSIVELAVLLPELLRTNGKISLSNQYSDVFKNIQDLFTPFLTETQFLSFVALSRVEYSRFMSTLTQLLIKLDAGGTKLGNIIKDTISVEDLTKAISGLENINQKVFIPYIISLVTELLQAFPILPPYFEEALQALRYRCRTGTPINKFQMLEESLNLLTLNQSSVHAHVNIGNYYYHNATGENPSLLFYHSRKQVSLQTHRPHLFNFIRTYIQQHPNNPACVELRKGFLIMQKDQPIDLPVNEHHLAMKHFKRAMQLGNSMGLFAFGLAAILIRDREKQSGPLKNFDENDTLNYQNGVKMLTEAVTKKPVEYKYNICRSEWEKVGQAHVLLGYQYEKGYLPRDFDKAKALYQTAVTVYNNEIASYYLGSMYYDGFGVRKSYIWAKLYWEHSVIYTKREWPVYAVVDYYLKHLEFSQAEMQASSMGIIEPRTTYNEQLKCLLGRMVRFRQHNLATKLAELTRQLVACEETWNLSGKGLTFLERLKRVELLGFKHKFGATIKAVYYFFRLSYGTERNCMGDGGTMSAYVHGVDKSLEVDYSHLFSRLYLVAPARIFTVTTFRRNLATNEHPRWNIKYKTLSRDKLLEKIPNTFQDECPPEQFTVVENLLYAEDGIYVITS